jgi:hypothetical protein
MGESLPGEWVLLAYRLPREPSRPRLALWRSLRRLGAAQLLDGLVALPADNRSKEQLEWLADSVLEAQGEAAIWLGRPGSKAQERTIAERMKAASVAEYTEIIDQAQAARDEPARTRKRTLGRLRRELRRIRRRDYFWAPKRDAAFEAVEALAASIQKAPA